jgi:Uri superfamily endonuclease
MAMPIMTILSKSNCMETKPGTYALILQSSRKDEIQVGRWGQLTIEPGYYLYVGSAFGPGGVQARVMRHCKETKSRHWHIDYLSELVNPVGAWYSYGTRELEHQWALAISRMAGMQSVKGFGCSDCRCESHLFVTSAKPDFGNFSSIVGGDVETWSNHECG